MSNIPIRAAQYVRMSTEHQQYSTENQSDVIAEYARKRGMEIVRTFADSGKSGLRIEGREALQQLMAVVQSGKADFERVLVYDVSRWGRFQDADESAHYEFMCKLAGIQVLYCAEQFENDGSPVATIVKGVKRAMAGEYSRELSAKVFKGQCRLIELGFRQGGSAGYGLRRRLIDQAGQVKGDLAFREHKSIQTDRVILVPGPPEEVEVVRRIYRLFIRERRGEQQIADLLNAEGVAAENGHAWTRARVLGVLTNEKYLGHNIYNRVSFKLKKQIVHNPPEQWVRRDDAFEAIVEGQDFHTARGILLGRCVRLSDEEMLTRLRELRDRHGKVSAILINETDGMPSSAVYRHRFGTLVRAYQLIGYTPERDFAFIEINRLLRKMHAGTVDDVVGALQRQGAEVEREADTDLLLVNRELSVSLVLARCRRLDAGRLHWQIRLEQGLHPDLTIAVRMEPGNEAPLDYYLLPSLDMRVEKLRVGEHNGVEVDGYRFDTLDFFYGMAERVRVEVAA
jgi:DNA invertase Pin-like site-specific DNA recombinase